MIFRVGRALLDGSNKEIILDSMDQQPTSLVVRHSAQGSVVFWTDRISKKLWSLKENSTEPSSMKSFDQPILAVASADSFQHLDKHVCSQLIVMRDQVCLNSYNYFNLHSSSFFLKHQNSVWN